ncbi:o-succinylbenzoate synthase [Kocuria gwangalliensis]|uniref:o-succinylbenzoate synthase n=3 Tax=Kocuria TaxID=57493 RepID=A0ABP8WDN6_9MICC
MTQGRSRETYPGFMTSPHALNLPPVADLLDTVRVVGLPMRVKFRGITVRETAIFHGPAGWGEFGPFPEYGDAEAAQWLRAGIEAAWQGFPDPVRSSIPVNATVPAVPADRVADVLAGYGGAVPAVKIKVAERGQSLADDVARVAAVRDLLPGAELRVDANMGWDEEQAVAALTELAAFDLEYAEQPVATIEGLAAVRQRLRDKSIDLKIAADESVRKAEDPLAVARAGAADLIIVKVAPLGGVRRALELVRDAGLPAVVSSAIDSSVGIRAGVALAAALPELPYACGLGTLSLMAADVTRKSLKPQEGHIPVRDAAVDQDLLAEFAVTGERRDWWLDRIRRTHAVLAG